MISSNAYADTTINKNKDEQQQDAKNDKSKNNKNNNNDGSDNTDNNNNNNNPFSSSSSLETENHCSKDIVPRPNYIDKNGCIIPCPTTSGNQDNTIPVGCPITSTTPSQNTSTTPSSQNQQNNLIDPSKGLLSSLNNNLLNPYLLGRDTEINAPLPKGVLLTETSREIGNNCGDKINNDKDGKIDSNDEDCDKGKKTYNGCVGISYYSCNEICDNGVDNNLNRPGENKANK
jgi:hypothetical protein